jgi:hypothetical protein
VNGIPTGSWDDFLRARGSSEGQLLARVFRQGVEFDVSLTLRASNRSPLEIIDELQSRGVMPSGDGELDS